MEPREIEPMASAVRLHTPDYAVPVAAGRRFGNAPKDAIQISAALIPVWER